MPYWPIKTLRIDSQDYKPVGPEWSGFYDWLRAEDGSVLGVRYHATEETSFLLEEARDLNYAATGQYQDLCVFFGKIQTFDPAQSEDQDFAYDQVFVSPGMASAICFSTENLSASQIGDLMKDRESLSVEASYVPVELKG